MRWEYQIVTVDVFGWLAPNVNAPKIQEVLNDLGAEGWELITVVDTNIRQGASDGLLLFLKRAVAEAPP